MMRFTNYLLLLFILISCDSPKLPEGFSSIESIRPKIELELRYASSDNFLGRPVKGYETPKTILTTETIEALNRVQKSLAQEELGLKLFDGYRPQRAVNDFIAWSTDRLDTLTKAKYYPLIPKDSIIPLGYVAERSGHSRGSTVDLTIIHTDSLNYGIELDMGSGWDYFGRKSWGNYDSITDLQKQNRKKLQTVMIQHGFKPYSKEWWHFTLKDEPFPDTYFDY